jgi:hypothetical protein
MSNLSAKDRATKGGPEMTDPDLELANDLLRGAREIAPFLSMTPRSLYYHVEHGRIPVFRFKSQIWARKSTLRKWIEDEEKRNNKNTRRDDPDDVDHDDSDRNDDR